MQPKTEYARSGKLHIAYQVVGQGPRDLVYVPGWVSHVELAWEEPALARFLNRLASFSRLIDFDERGTEWTTCAKANTARSLAKAMDSRVRITATVKSYPAPDDREFPRVTIEITDEI